MKIKTPTATTYRFECLDRASIVDCFEKGGTDGLRELVDALRGDLDVLTRLADAVDAGKAYDFRHDRICTWWGWG
jgi:hypothetical protein